MDRITAADICSCGSQIDEHGRHYYIETKKSFMERWAKKIPADARNREQLVKDLEKRAESYVGQRVYGGLCPKREVA